MLTTDSIHRPFRMYESLKKYMRRNEAAKEQYMFPFYVSWQIRS